MDGDGIGAKRFADKASGGCSHRKFSKEFETKLNESRPIHDGIKKEVREQLEKGEFKCNEEVDLEVDLGGSKLRGSADIVCREPVESTKEPKEPVELIVEVKSSQIGMGRIADIYQALVYGYIWEKRYGKKPQIMLVYSRESKTTSETTMDTKTKVNIGSRMVELPNKYVYIKLNINLDVEDIAKELGRYGYVLSRDCEYCVNEDCPLNKARPTRQ